MIHQLCVLCSKPLCGLKVLLIRKSIGETEIWLESSIQINSHTLLDSKLILYAISQQAHFGMEMQASKC